MAFAIPSVALTPVHAFQNGSSENVSNRNKISSLVANVLKVIRSHMPITSLFKPELKLDLALFVRDQQLFYRIAQLLAALPEEEWNEEAIANRFETSDFYALIKNLFNDPSIYLPFFWKGCVDVLRNQSTSSKIREAIEGRIFTLKNALIAQQNPKWISDGQQKHKVLQQSEEVIKEVGVSFIRESLYFHLLALKASEIPFKEQLKSVITQLVPFTRRITRAFLLENGKNCSDDPLTFRNPSGYNIHGHCAAMIMEASLNALGYETRLLLRTDLEPKVNLAAFNTIIEVTSLDGRHYYIDPCYVQFLKDVYTQDHPLPTDPFLLLEEGEIDSFIEEKIVAPWKANYRRYKAGDQQLFMQLKANDQWLAYMFNDIGLIAEAAPLNPEEWFRKSFQRVWKPQGYTFVATKMAFQDLFQGNSTQQRTYQLLKPMGMLALIKEHDSTQAVTERLDGLLKAKTHQRQNSFAALSCIGQLQEKQRANYASLLDTDPRNELVDAAVNAYFRALRAQVNPQGKKLTALYACAGADCSSILLATDAQELLFVDLTPVRLRDFESVLKILLDQQAFKKAVSALDKEGYFATRRRFLSAMSELTSQGQHLMHHLVLKLFIDLEQAGVDSKKITLSEQGGAITLNFPWQYYGDRTPKMRTLVYVQADITQPHKYPLTLQEKLAKGIDIFYLKGAFFVPKFYAQFLPTIAKAINPQGWLMTTDMTNLMEPFDPMPCLEKISLKFQRKTNETISRLEELMELPFNHFGSLTMLEEYPPDQRHDRIAGCGLTYWTILNCRQKI